MTSKPQSSLTSRGVSQEERQSEEGIYSSQALPQSPIQTQNEEDDLQSATPTTSEATHIPKRRVLKRSRETTSEELAEHEKRLKTGPQQLATTPFPDEGTLLKVEEKQVPPFVGNRVASISSAREGNNLKSIRLQVNTNLNLFCFRRGRAILDTPNKRRKR
jgi:hypothetical protein